MQSIEEMAGVCNFPNEFLKKCISTVHNMPVWALPKARWNVILYMKYIGMCMFMYNLYCTAVLMADTLNINGFYVDNISEMKVHWDYMWLNVTKI